MAPTFTVLLPTHDRADVVGCAIRCVLDQTASDFELLIVGDGCTDDTAKVVAGFGDARIRWFDLPKAPFFGYANRNVAMREARGALVAFMAHDDLMLPDHLERLGACFAAPDVEWAYSRPMWVSDEGLMVPFAIDLRKPAQLARFLGVANSIPASCVMYRRTCLDRYGEWPEDVPSAADWEYWRRMIRPSAGANIAYLPDVTTLHFRAGWRDPVGWGAAPLHRWLAYAAGRDSWPRALQADVLPDEPPQASILRAMEGDPARWTAAVRTATSEATDVLAWTQAAEFDQLDQDLVRARAEAQAYEVGSAAARAEADRWHAEADRWHAEAHASTRGAAEAMARTDQARAELESLLVSRSWRLTAPLRRTRALLRRPAPPD